MIRSSSSRRIIIKKYGNRRLYDTSQSRYLTLVELVDRIREGFDVHVVSANDGADITQAVLTQIILEDRKLAALLPVHLLLQLIRLDDDALAEFTSRYLAAALELYLFARQNARTMSAFNPLSTMPLDITSGLARMVMRRTNSMDWRSQDNWRAQDTGDYPQSSPMDLPPQMEPPFPPENGANNDELALLRRELEELKKSLADHSSPKTRKAPPKRSAASAKRKKPGLQTKAASSASATKSKVGAPKTRRSSKSKTETC